MIKPDIQIYDCSQLRDPPIGSKAVCIRRPGAYILQRGAALWRGISCTHAGSGVVAIYDGIPNDKGFFPDEPIAKIDEKGVHILEDYDGRLLHYANPSVMGMWMYDAGCLYGLSILIRGEHSAVTPVLSVTWLPYKPPVRREVIAGGTKS